MPCMQSRQVSKVVGRQKRNRKVQSEDSRAREKRRRDVDCSKKGGRVVVLTTAPDYTPTTHHALLLRLFHRQLSLHTQGHFKKLTLQHLRLRRIRLTRTLQRPSVTKIQHHAIRQLLAVLVRWIRGAELAEVEALDDSLFVGARGAEDEVA